MSSPASASALATSSNHVLAKKNSRIAVVFKNMKELVLDAADGKITADLKIKMDAINADHKIKMDAIIADRKVKMDAFIHENMGAFISHVEKYKEEEIDEQYHIQKEKLAGGDSSSPSIAESSVVKVQMTTSPKWGVNDKALTIKDSSSSNGSSASNSDNKWTMQGKPVPTDSEMRDMAFKIWGHLNNVLAKILISGYKSFIVQEDLRISRGTFSLVVSRLNRKAQPNVSIIHEIRGVCIGSSTEGTTDIIVLRLKNKNDRVGELKETSSHLTQNLYRNGAYTDLFYAIIEQFWNTYYPRYMVKA